MLTIAIGAYVSGFFLDLGISARVLVSAAGLVMLIPAALWAWAVRVWRPVVVQERAAAD
jgi:hypothetical protein